MDRYELRIGNKVFNDYRMETICEIGQANHVFTEESGFANMPHIRPIELSDSILEWAGFRLESLSRHEYKRHEIQTIEKRYVMVNFENDVLFEVVSTESDHGVSYTCRFKSNIKYMHQLQNIFYIVNGQDLEFDTPQPNNK